ncbi:unnamed protein product [Prorocentrum cordatum]|nr:unnamed protein product [Polarella glacialis]
MPAPESEARRSQCSEASAGSARGFGTQASSAVGGGRRHPQSRWGRPSMFGIGIWKKLLDRPSVRRGRRAIQRGRRALNNSLFAQEVEQKSWLAGVVSSARFELTMAIIILLNTFCIAVEAQYQGIDSGYDSGVAPNIRQPADKAWPGATSVFLGLEWFYGVLFTSELIVKLVAVPQKTLKDAWSVIDVLVVAFFWIEALERDLPFPPTLIRLARMARLLRFLRVVKTIKGFGSLYLMLQSIKGSVSALGWASVVVLMGEMVLALALNLLVRDYWENESLDLEEREVLFEYFGTFTKSLLTMIEMLLGNWFSVTRILIRFNEWFMVFGICHQLVFGFAVIEVISGVFLNETFKVAALDDSIMLEEARRTAKAESDKLTEFFNMADEDDNGYVDPDELRRALENKKVTEWLSAMGLDLSDVDRVFSLLDKDRDGRLTCEELVRIAVLLKKPARAADIAVLKSLLEEVKACIDPAKP